MNAKGRLLSALLVLLVMACGPGGVGTGVRQVAYPEMKPPPPGPVEVEPYRILKGDLLTIAFPNNPELNLSQVPVRWDGKVALNLAGDVTAFGLTTRELQEAVAKKYRDFVARTKYSQVLKEGDYFDLRFVYNPELNIGARIRSDGKVSLPLLGDIQAAGLTPEAFRQDLIKRYSRDIRKPDIALMLGVNPNAFPMDIAAKKIYDQGHFITVTLNKSAGAFVFVGGEVGSPKPVPFEGNMTVLQAIMAAGGKKETSDLSRVVILRRGQFDQTEWMQTDLVSPGKGKDLKNDVALRPGDVVIVPMSGIAQVGLFVKQWIRDVVPLYGSYNINLGSTSGIFTSPIP
jgi:protein involved in polysaccharide export with SLBB domain